MKNESIFEKYKRTGKSEFDEIKKIQEEGMIGYDAEIVSANILNAKVRTNGYHGGDAGHGGHSYIELQNSSCSCMQITVSDEDGVVFQTEEGESGQSVRIDMRGDTELYTLIKSLRFMADALEDSADYGKQKYGVSGYVIVVDTKSEDASVEYAVSLEDALDGNMVVNEVVLMAKGDTRYRVLVVSKNETDAKEKASVLVDQYLCDTNNGIKKPCNEWKPLISKEQFSKIPWWEFKYTTEKCRDELYEAYPLEFGNVIREYKRHNLLERLKSENTRTKVDVFMAMNQHLM